MLPMSCRENVKHTDDDGIVYTFKPMTGELEREFMSLYKDVKEISSEEWGSKLDELFKKVLVSAVDSKGRCTGNIDFNTTEKSQVIIIWKKINSITDEEKKS